MTFSFLQRNFPELRVKHYRCGVLKLMDRILKQIVALRLENLLELIRKLGVN